MVRDVRTYFRQIYALLRSFNISPPSVLPSPPVRIQVLIETQRLLFLLKQNHPREIPSLEGLAYTEKELEHWLKTKQVLL